MINNAPIARVPQFSYFGTMINEDWDHSQKVGYRIKKARAAFNEMGKLFKSRSFNIDKSSMLSFLNTFLCNGRIE